MSWWWIQATQLKGQTIGSPWTTISSEPERGTALATLDGTNAGGRSTGFINNTVAAAAVAASTKNKPTNGYDRRRVQQPTTKLNTRQIFYLAVIQGLSAMILAGGINFAVGYPIYATPRPPPGPPPQGSIPPFLFGPPVSLLVDAAVTTILQSLITWFCLLFFVNRALVAGDIAPHVPGWLLQGREPGNGFVRWFMFLDHYNAQRGSVVFGWCCGGGRRGRCRGGFARAVGFVFAGLGRGLLVAVAGFAVMIGPTIRLGVAAGTPYQGDWVFLGRWDGAVFKLVYGAVLGLVISPPIAWMWMVRAGWIVRRNAMSA
ncbi:hypothetical protein C8A00DRAFT_35397 [Chaetomidium leptoderma]|uniref:Uncharacterized protein n=1 Tax=Chaetomidium leptoderma TaxID=669021 RepID=A0AAN6ZU23_9PEZI|nr:hypothetical protein C8A00DRAFT_35397 [Chaetomidium leptoderma]